MFVLTDVLTIGLAAGAVSATITRSKMGGPLRGWLRGLGAWGRGVSECPYCLVHWVALPLTFLIDARAYDGQPALVVLGTYLAAIGVGGIAAGLLDVLIFKPRDEAERTHASLIESLSNVTAKLNEIAERRDV